MVEELKYLRGTTTTQNDIIIDMKETIGKQQEHINSLLSMGDANANKGKDYLITSSSQEPEVRGNYTTNI